MTNSRKRIKVLFMLKRSVQIFVLTFVIAFGAFLIFPSGFKRAKNSVVNTVRNFDWDWTGFFATKVITTTQEKNQQGQIQKTTTTEQIHSGKKLWDWLDLVAVPTVVAILGYWFQQRDKKKAEEQYKREMQIAQDNLSEVAIQAYLDGMANLLLDKELAKELFPNVNDNSELSYQDNPIRDVARVKTTTVLRRLEGDEKRQAIIIAFLRDAELYGFIFKRVNLEGASLERANLRQADLEGADLKEANLEQAKLTRADLTKVNLGKANLKEANLERANLREANLVRANLKEANLEGANLRKADLRGANLGRANLKEADLGGADLGGADLKEANLEGTNLEGANLWRANLWRANLWRANLKEVYLWRANLWGANLKGVILKRADLNGANLWGADLKDADLKDADLKGANLRETHFIDARNLMPKQIKSGCFWEEAIYKAEYNSEKQAWVVNEYDNKNFVEKLRKDQLSDLEYPLDCSIWNN